jgi:pyruvate kinase
MLNKGPYINDAVLVLDNILRRMADHHYKKTAVASLGRCKRSRT